MKEKWIQVFLTGVFMHLLCGFAAGQLVINPIEAPKPFVKPDMLWNVVVINEGRTDIVGKLQLNVEDENHRIVLSGISNYITFSKGTKVLNYNSVAPINYTYNSNIDYSTWMKVGKYNLCFTILCSTVDGGAINSVAEDCMEMDIEPLSPPVLNMPEDKSTIYETRPNFMWTPPAPVNLFTQLRYEIKVVEMNKNQSAENALINNSPVYFENGLTSNSRLLPSSYKELDVNNEYAWQVTAYDNSYSIKCEPFVFSLVQDSVMVIIEKSPYINMRQSKVQTGVMNQGYIKIVLTNNTIDTIAQLFITQEGSYEDIANAKVTIKRGINYILKEINTKSKLDEKKTYELVWINSRNEKWIVKFQPKYYR